ncbi:MAG: hypothetical protein ACQ5SW_09730, partial [Sphaerochaetaceae bacterium]
SLQVDIQEKQKAIEQHHRDLSALYMDLAESVFPIEENVSLGYAHTAYEQYRDALQNWKDAKHSFEQVSVYIEQMEDRSRKIKEITTDIKALDQPKRNVYAQIGAIAYEAYGSETLPLHIKEVCQPLFEEHQKRTRRLESRLDVYRGKLGRQVLRHRLDTTRRQMVGLLSKAGKSLVEIGCEADLPLERHPDVPKQLGALRQKESALQQELELHRSAIVRLRSEEVPSPKARLEERSQAMNKEEKVCHKAAYTYGKALYEELPDSVHANQVGQKAIALMDQITLHRSRIRTLEQDIKTLQNLIMVQELEAQIELEGQKIEHLKTQIETFNRQIAQVHASIQLKQNKISELLPKKEPEIDG